MIHRVLARSSTFHHADDRSASFQNMVLADVNGLYDSFMNSLLQVNTSTGVVGSSSLIQGRELATVIVF